MKSSLSYLGFALAMAQIAQHPDDEINIFDERKPIKKSIPKRPQARRDQRMKLEDLNLSYPGEIPKGCQIEIHTISGYKHSGEEKIYFEVKAEIVGATLKSRNKYKNKLQNQFQEMIFTHSLDSLIEMGLTPFYQEKDLNQ